MHLREVGSALQVLLPITIANNHRRRAVKTGLLGREFTASERFHAHHLEKILRYEGYVDANRLAAARNRIRRGEKRSEARQSVVLQPKIEEVWICQAVATTVSFFFPHRHESLSVGIRERAEQNGVHHGKDG